MKKVLTAQKRIRFQNCDPFGHLNNSAYLDYMLNAREDGLRSEYNLDMFEMIQKQGKGWVVGKNEIVYRKGALLNEIVTIESRLMHFAPKYVLVEYLMFNENKTELKSAMWGTFVHVDAREQKAISHDESLTQLFEKVVTPLEETSLDQRVKNIESKLTITL